MKKQILILLFWIFAPLASAKNVQQILDDGIAKISIPKGCSVGAYLAKYDDSGIEVGTYRGDRLLYTASMSKLLILLALADQVEKGQQEWNAYSLQQAELMIRNSSNTAPGRIMRMLGGPYRGKQCVADIVESYGFDKGLFWVGQGYGNGSGPGHLRGVSYNHEGTANGVGLFYEKLHAGELPQQEMMLKIMTETKIMNRFARGLVKSGVPLDQMYRKSGSYGPLYSYADSVMWKCPNQEENCHYAAVLITQGKSCFDKDEVYKTWHENLIQYWNQELSQKK